MRRSMHTLMRLLIVANIALVTALVTAAVAFWATSLNPGHPPQAAEAAIRPSGSASSSPELMVMGLAHIPTSNACVLCHDTGGKSGLKPIPAIGHPLEGWRQCAACHTGEKLGRTAPGHDGITGNECLNCHKEAPQGPAITQPHSRLQDQNCLDCHGSYAHLPSSMVGRDQTECWLCHKPTALPPPEYPHALNTSHSCRDCHQTAEVGNLPIDHALRADNTCLLCHDIKRVDASPSPSPASG